MLAAMASPPAPAMDPRQWFAAVVEHAELAILSKGLDGRILTWNGAAEAMYGYTADEVVGRYVSLLMPEDRAGEMESILGRLAAGERIHHFETKRRRKDGQILDVSLSISPVRDERGVIIGAATIARDITHVKRLEQQLRQAQKMEAIGRLSGGIAHDFNNLLTGIIGYAMLAMDRPGGTTVGDELEEIVKAGERAAELTRQLLAFSRQQPVEAKVVSLNDAVAGMERMLRRLLGEDIELTCRLAPDVCPIVADVTQLQQILLNLSANARDAMPEGGTLTVETATVELGEQYAASHAGVMPGTHAVLTVTDSGVGIDPVDRDRVFEPFFTTKPPGAGTGLGLATVFGIVEQNNGHVWVYSEPGHGACFKVYLPAAEEPVAAQRAAEEGTAVPAPAEAAILVVEDEELVRLLATEVLGGAGYEVVAASNGAVALQLAAERPDGFDLVVTDVVMPGMRGTEVVERLGHPPALYMSGYTGETSIQRGLVGAGEPFLSKPFSPQSLLAAVRRVLEARSRGSG
jgi:PAS domain S-box-containing protein